jgi:hypothetical protein
MASPKTSTFFPRGRSVGRRQATKRLHLERLEDRVVLTIVFAPHYGAETVSTPLGPTMTNAPVYLLFWGSYWDTSAGSASEKQLVDAITNEFNSPIYNRLSQYHSGPAYVYGSQNGGQPVYWTATEDADPTNGFTDWQLQSVIVDAIDDPNSPIYSPNDTERKDGGYAPIYLVITPPNIEDFSGDYGYNSEFANANLRDGTQNVIYGWIGNGLNPSYNTQDFVTLDAGNITADALTDPARVDNRGYWFASGPSYPGGGGIYGQIADWEPAWEPPYSLSYSYRVNGSLTQALWDQNAGAFTVNDGTTQNFYVTPQYDSSGSYIGNTLSIYGDQLGDNYVINTTSTGGLRVTVNGETAAFDPGQITTLDVYTGGGGNVLNVVGTPSGMSTNIYGQGIFDQVVMGSLDQPPAGHGGPPPGSGDGYMSNIRGSVHFYGPGAIYLYLDDSGDTTGQTVSMYDGQINYGGAAPIYYTPADWSHGGDSGVLWLNVLGGYGYNTYDVHATSNLSVTVLDTGHGGAKVNIYTTINTARSLLEIVNSGGHDDVHVGLGSMANINGLIEVRGAGSTSLYVEDWNDSTGRTVTMNDGELFGMGGTGTITWAPTSSASGGVTSLGVYGGSGGNTFNVNTTSKFYSSTWLNTGTGNDKVNVYATKGELDDYNPGGTDNTNIGFGSLASISGPVYVYGVGSTALLVDDNKDSTACNATLTSSTVTGLGNAGTIYYNLGGVTSLTVNGGTVANTFNIQSTVAATPVTVNGGAVADTFNVGNTSNNLNNILGALTINGGGSNTLNVKDQGSATGQSYTLSNTTLTRSGIATIRYSYLTNLNITASSNDKLTLLAPAPTVATTFNGGAGSNTLQGANVSNTWTISGANSGKVGSVSFSNVQYLIGGALSDSFKLQPLGSVTGTINGSGGTNTLDYSSRTTGVTVNLATGAATAIHGGAAGGFSGISALVGSSSTSDLLIGPNATNTWIISGANSGTVGTFGFSAVENLTGGTSTDAFKFTSAGSVTGKIDGGGGTNTLDYSGDGGVAATVNLATSTATKTGGFAHILKLVGSSSTSDRLIGPNTTNTWTLTGANAGTLGAFSFSAVENLTGGSGLDLFVFRAGATVSGKIDGGGGGTDWLDYAAYTTPVTVNLATNSATGVGGGIAHIRNVRGGRGGNTLTGTALGNILIGGAGPNTLVGGAGRSLLIGGPGKDTITGHSGGDILIAGSTDYDASSLAHDLALESLLAEWQSANSYATRIGHLKNGGGLNGSNKLIWGVTVHDNSTANANKLTGGGGASGQNWFVANLTHTTTNKTPQEQLN